MMYASATLPHSSASSPDPLPTSSSRLVSSRLVSSRLVSPSPFISRSHLAVGNHVFLSQDGSGWYRDSE